MAVRTRKAPWAFENAPHGFNIMLASWSKFMCFISMGRKSEYFYSWLVSLPSRWNPETTINEQKNRMLPITPFGIDACAFTLLYDNLSRGAVYLWTFCLLERTWRENWVAQALKWSWAANDPQIKPQMILVARFWKATENLRGTYWTRTDSSEKN